MNEIERINKRIATNEKKRDELIKERDELIEAEKKRATQLEVNKKRLNEFLNKHENLEYLDGERFVYKVKNEVILECFWYIDDDEAGKRLNDAISYIEWMIKLYDAIKRVDFSGELDGTLRFSKFIGCTAKFEISEDSYLKEKSFEMTVKSDTDYGGLIEYPLGGNTTLSIKSETDYSYVCVKEIRSVNLSNVRGALLDALKNVQNKSKKIVTRPY
jgi:hypothetical protein